MCGETYYYTIAFRALGGNTFASMTELTETGELIAGVYKIVVAGNNGLPGEKVLEYQITPKGTSLVSMTAGSNRFEVTWTKQPTQAAGYELQYSTSKKFTKATTTTMQLSKKKTSATVAKLKAKKTYYARIRTYKEAGDGKVVSTWSEAKQVKTKA